MGEKSKHRNRRKPYPRYMNGRADLKPVDARGWSTSGIYAQVDSKYPLRQGARWNKVESAYLAAAFLWGASADEMTADHQRTLGGVDGQLNRLGLLY